MLEAEFKERRRKFWLKNKIYTSVFFIETEPTEKGFPDVLCFDADDKAALYEVKVTRGKDNVIEFERNQPLWFKKNSRIKNVFILAYDNVTKLVHCFPASALFNPLSEYHLPLGSLKKQLPQHKTNYTTDVVD